MSGVIIRELRREDFADVRRLYAATKSRLRNEAYDRWCLFDTPWGDSVSVVAVDGSQCVGLFVFRPTMLDLGGEEVMSGQATDLMTHPDYRRRGLFVAMVEESIKLAISRGYEVVYAFPDEQGKSYPGFIHRLNFDHVGSVLAWKYDLRSFRLPLPSWSTLRRPLLTIGENDITEGELDAAIQMVKKETGICCIKRDQKWLAWRYTKGTCETYRWYAARDSGGRLLAAMLVGEYDDSWVRAVKGDVRIHEVFSSSEDALVAVLEALIRRAKTEAKTSIRVLVKDEKKEAALRKAGFRRTGSLPLAVRKLSGRTLKGNVHDFASWRIMGGDVDVF